MKVCHVTTWNPNGSGLMEASLNMFKADVISGHDVFIIDTGIKADLSKKAPSVGESVMRGSLEIITSHNSALDIADIIVLHTYCPDEWLSRNQAPIIYINHARPEASYRQEFDEPKYQAYSAYGSASYRPRIKKMVYFWPEFTPYWEVVCDKNKLVAFECPAVDDEKFSPTGSKYQIAPDKIGEINGFICDPNRRDITRFDLFIGAYHASKKIPGLKWHIVGLDDPIKLCEQNLLAKIREIGGLGTVGLRIHTIEDFYRSMDFLFTNQMISTQTVVEAISCGLKVIAPLGNQFAANTIDIKNPYEVADAINKLDSYENEFVWTLKEFGCKMNKVYEEVIKNG